AQADTKRISLIPVRSDDIQTIGELAPAVGMLRHKGDVVTNQFEVWLSFFLDQIKDRLRGDIIRQSLGITIPVNFREALRRIGIKNKYRAVGQRFDGDRIDERRRGLLQRETLREPATRSLAH